MMLVVFLRDLYDSCDLGRMFVILVVWGRTLVILARKFVIIVISVWMFGLLGRITVINHDWGQDSYDFGKGLCASIGSGRILLIFARMFV